MSSTFGGSRSSAELPVVIVQPQHSDSCQPIALTLVNQAKMRNVSPSSFRPNDLASPR